MKNLERRICFKLNKKLDAIATAVKVNQTADTLDFFLQRSILKQLPKTTLKDFEIYDKIIKSEVNAELHIVII